MHCFRLQRLVLQGVQSADKLPGLLACLHSSNACLRWLMLHTAGHRHSKVATALDKQGVGQEALLKLLLDTAFLESWVGLLAGMTVTSVQALVVRQGRKSKVVWAVALVG